VIVELSSGDGTLLTIQGSVTIFPGSASTGVPIQAIAQTLPFSTRAATISATYAGKTLSSAPIDWFRRRCRS